MHVLQLLWWIASLVLAAHSPLQVQSLADVPDAMSVQLPREASHAAISWRIGGKWSAWEEFTVENEQDPLLRESDLVMIPDTADAVRIERTHDVVLHPISVSRAPVRYEVAARTNPGTPKILTRKEWGADDSLLYTTNAAPPPSSAPSGDNGEAQPASQRVRDCEDAQLNYPDEFKTIGKMNTDETGKRLRWAHEYSPQVRLIAVHHTAVKVEGDTRTGAERVRALYQYHAVNRGWGDIGYHYLIDEKGQIYEGKSGGDYVVGGHAYCNNIGSVGVALLGNFEEEEPAQEQLKSLQWLLHSLAGTYDIDLAENIRFHGKNLPPVVGHGDLVSTDCPGFYVKGSLAQIRTHVAKNDLYASVQLPVKSAPATVARAAGRAQTRQQTVVTAHATGPLTRSVQRLLATRASQTLRRKLGTNPGKSIEQGTAARRAARLHQTDSASSMRSRSSSKQQSSPRSAPAVRQRSSRTRSASSEPVIRVKLSLNADRVSFPAGMQLNGSDALTAFAVSASNAVCEARTVAGQLLASGVLRIESADRIVSIDAPSLKSTRYRGTIECRVVDGRLTLINELPLDSYMAGLAEEPDTEPFEKQRAFAIAARTYAAWYLAPEHRKFPDKPYDGSDNPAEFQVYGGYDFEQQNPHWTNAVASTAGMTLTKGGSLIKPPYFSADSGRTRTPAQAGWSNFPFAEIFSAKDDPWCAGLQLRGHGVGMSGCGAKGQAEEGKRAEEILGYYYPGTVIMGK